MDFIELHHSHRLDKRGYYNKRNNLKIYQLWLNRLILLDTAIFEWKGFPKTIDTRQLELNLCFNGMMCFFKEDVLKSYFCLPVNLGANYDVNGIPYDRWVYSNYNAYHNKMNPYNSVLIFNDFLYMPHYPQLTDYAHRLAEIQLTMDMNVHAQRTPILIRTDRKQELTMKNLYQQYEEFMPVIYGAEELGELSSFEVIKTDAPYYADRLDVLLHNVFNEALSFMGYDNANQDKKERQVVAETDGNNGQIIGQRNERLIMREEAAQKINSLFPDLDISVDIRKNLSIANVDTTYSYMYRNYDQQTKLQGGLNDENN